MLKIIKNIVVLLFVLFVQIIPIIAQINTVGYPFIKNFQKYDYQAGMQSWAISQSAEGLMYFANNSGLLEFDGQKWDLFSMIDGLTVRSVFVDSSGKIFIGTGNDFGYYNRNKSGTLEYYSLFEKSKISKDDYEEIWEIHKINNCIVFQSYTQLLLYENDSIKIIKAPNKFHFSFEVNNKLYVVDIIDGIYEFSDENLNLLPNTDFFVNKEITSILPLADNLLISTLDDGAFVYDFQNIEEWNTSFSDFFRSNQIYSAIKINPEQIAFGTVQDGVLITSINGDLILHVNENKGLQNNTILSMFNDNNGNLWLGTDNGIDLLLINSPFRLINKFNGISAGYTAVLYDDVLYLGTNRGVFYKKINDFTNITSTIDKDFNLIEETKGQVWQLQVLDGVLFCGHNNGAYIIDGSHASKISNVPGFWTFVKSKNNPNKIIAGTYNGLVLLEKINGKWIFSNKIDGFEESCRIIAFDENENLWVSHVYKGVFHVFIDDSLNKVVNVDFFNEKNGFQTYFGINLAKINDAILFLTPDGVYTYNKQSNLIEKADEFNRLMKNRYITHAYQSKNDDIWFFSDKKIFVNRFLEDGLFSEIELPFNPLQGKFIDNFEFIYTILDDFIILGYENGFILYDQNFKKDYQKEFKIFISSLKLSANDSIIFKGKLFNSNDGEIELDYSQNGLHFFFSAIDFENPDKLEFSTFLEGYDLLWSDWEKQYDREFTNLREGKYSFYLKAKNVYGIETQPLVFSFTIKPPFYRTKLAYLVYLISFVLFIVLIVYAIIKRIEKVRLREKEYQKQKYRERENRLKQDALIAEKEIIKLRNDKLRQEMKIKDKELAESTMQTIQKNKFLINIKSDLAKIAKLTPSVQVKRSAKSSIRKIDNDINNEKNWKVFEKHFLDVHEEFLNRFKKEYPQITPSELRLCACLRMNLSTKEIASLFNLSVRGVETSRYRLRKALDLDRKINLTDFILSF